MSKVKMRPLWEHYGEYLVIMKHNAEHCVETIALMKDKYGEDFAMKARLHFREKTEKKK